MANRLAGESSPYLRQHADNPVDWYPWGDEAREAAADRDAPVLLSVGYSSCHWCHVMAHESFEDPATAEVMNDLYVNVKVDREERPDVDAVYMDAVVAMTGQGGWPMTVFLAPDGRPFYGGTYYPNQSRGGMPAFTDVLHAVHEAWVDRRDHVFEQADELTEALHRVADAQPTDLPNPDTLRAGIGMIRNQYDTEWGGFGSQPKFPQAMTVDLLLRSHAGGRAPGLVEIATGSLDAMAAGGIYDHIGGGFCRYAVDRQWLVPHFEKMLYDQALLTKAYLHGWQVSGEDHYRQVVDETIGYVLRDLAHPDGGFYSAEDADSEAVEGKFYTWSLDEFGHVLRAAGFDPSVIAYAAEWWGLKEQGNYANGAAPGNEAPNILHRRLGAEIGRPREIELARQALFAHRATRVRPGLDDKVLAEWNALMLTSLADAAVATGDESWRNAAVRNGEFLCDQMRRDDGRWLRSWQAETGGSGTAFAADHGALVTAFLRLGRLTGESRWVAEARATGDALIDLFWDDERGGVFTTGTDAEQLVTRPRDMTDNALPSANSHAAVALLDLARLTGVERYREHAEACLRLFTGLAPQDALFFGHALAAVDMFTARPSELVVTGDRPDLLSVADRRYMPNTVVAWGEPFESPLWNDREPDKAYLCESFACRLPVSSADDLTAQLDEVLRSARTSH